jgi:hypothetical protein
MSIDNWRLDVRLEPPLGQGVTLRRAIEIGPMQAEAFGKLSRDHDLFDDGPPGGMFDVMRMKAQREKEEHLGKREWLAQHLAEVLARELLTMLEERDPVRGYDKAELR